MAAAATAGGAAGRGGRSASCGCCWAEAMMAAASGLVDWAPPLPAAFLGDEPKPARALDMRLAAPPPPPPAAELAEPLGTAGAALEPAASARPIFD